MYDFQYDLNHKNLKKEEDNLVYQIIKLQIH